MTVDVIADGESHFRWYLDEIRLSGGERISLDPGTLLALVGPNNGGKSTILRDLAVPPTSSRTDRAVVSRAYRTEGLANFASWLESHYYSANGQFYSSFGRSSRGGQIASDELHELSELDGKLRERSWSFLVHSLDAGTRLSLGDPKPSIDIAQHPPTEYIHALQQDRVKEKLVQREVLEAFGKHLLINWGAGQSVGFHVADRQPELAAGGDRVSLAYLSQLGSNPRLEQQGDGLRSFVGTLLAAFCGAHKLLLIDEPEAFLHPTQARRLARILSDSCRRFDRQVVLATHSSDVLKGALDGGAKVSVCRITRHGDSNHGASLPNDRIEALWNRPLMRSSSKLEGMFQEGSVICESDSDCRFYEALFHRLRQRRRANPRSDLYFTHGGGKGAILPILRAYRELNVPCSVIVDIDLLRNQNHFSQLYEQAGGCFERVERDFRIAQVRLGELSTEKDLSELVSELEALLEELKKRKGGSVDDETIRKLNLATKGLGSWTQAKRIGLRGLRGEQAASLRRLIKNCFSVGLFIVPFGELESWWQTGPRSKSKWIADAVSMLESEPANFKRASLFVECICEYHEISLGLNPAIDELLAV